MFGCFPCVTATTQKISRASLLLFLVIEENSKSLAILDPVFKIQILKIGSGMNINLKFYAFIVQI